MNCTPLLFTTWAVHTVFDGQRIGSVIGMNEAAASRAAVKQYGQPSHHLEVREEK